MKRMSLLGFGIAAASLLAIPAALGGMSWPLGGFGARAQSGPPDINMVAYGDATGATIGQKVTAHVTVGAITQSCGQGVVIDSGGPKYVVRVLSDGAKAGCGTAGRTVSFYFAPTSPSEGGRRANETTTWQAGAGKLVNLTMGQALTVKARMPLTARDSP